jgi:hypothetical protein
MNRYHVEWTDRLSALMAGELGERERAEVEAHLAECGPCRQVLAELRDVVARAGALGDLEPPRDLWAGIESAIGAPPRPLPRDGDRDVLVLPSARAPVGVPAGTERTLGVRLAPLLAAAAVLVAISVTTTWWVANAGAGAAGTLETARLVDGDPVRAAATGTPPDDLASELATLEEVLEVARDALDPNTVRVLERNLGVIEQAIADSRQALELDPGNAFLTEHLQRMYRRKLTYLQDVVRVVQWEG